MDDKRAVFDESEPYPHEGSSADVSPASAGGAPAPNPAVVENVLASALMDQYGFLPLNVRYGAAAAARAVAENWTRSRPVPDAEILPADRKPAYGEPGLDTDWDEDADAMLIHGVGWNLSWGCKLSIARDHDTGEHYVCVNTSGEDQRKGIVSRSTTRERIASFGRQLLHVFGDPDPRDAEIAQLRAALDRHQKRLGDDLLSGGKLVERVRAALRVNDGGTCTRASMDGVVGDVGRLCDEVERLRLEVASARSIADEKRAVAEQLRGQVDDLTEAARAKEQQLFDRFAELVNPIREVFGKSPVTASHYRELRGGIERLILNRNATKAERDRLRQELDLQHADRLRRLCEALNVDSANESWLTAMRRVRHLRQNFSDSPRCEVAEADGWRCRLFAGHDGKHLAQKPTGERREWPFDNKRTPRRWIGGDPEPTVGTTVTWGAGFASWSLHGDGDWRSDACACESCLDAAGLPWTALLDAAHGELVEVVSSDGD
jgi:phage shock protein A